MRNHPDVARVLLGADADPKLLNADNDSPLKAALDRGNIDVALVIDPSRTDEVWQQGIFHSGLVPPPPPATKERTSKARARSDRDADPALWDLHRALKAHDKESRLLRKLLERTRGLGVTGDQLCASLQQQLRAAEDTSRRLRRLLDDKGEGEACILDIGAHGPDLRLRPAA